MSCRKKIGGKDQMGTLTVEVKTVDKTWFAVFYKGGDQGDTWHQGNVDLSVRILASLFTFTYMSNIDLLSYLQDWQSRNFLINSRKPSTW